MIVPDMPLGRVFLWTGCVRVNPTKVFLKCIFGSHAVRYMNQWSGGHRQRLLNYQHPHYRKSLMPFIPNTEVTSGRHCQMEAVFFASLHQVYFACIKVIRRWGWVACPLVVIMFKFGFHVYHGWMNKTSIASSFLNCTQVKAAPPGTSPGHLVAMFPTLSQVWRVLVAQESDQRGQW